MKKGLFCLLVVVLLGAAVAYEVKTHTLQAQWLPRFAAKMSYTVEPGPSDAIHFPGHGPHNERHGYSRLDAFVEKLENRGFDIARQARFSDDLLQFVSHGGNPPYREKLQAGITILDDGGNALYQVREPGPIYANFEDIPPLLVDSLLFIENRQLLNQQYPGRNPAVEWGRLAEVTVAHGINLVRPGQETAGASTLATQLEKYRYSPGGRTTDAAEKLRQMVSASLRAYRDGADTTLARQRIVRDYVNTTPLAGRTGFGEILGVGEGLWAWYAIDFHQANQLLRAETTPGNLVEKARVYKAVLSLLLSQRRPSHYLLGGREELTRLTDSYLRILGRAGLIDHRLRDAALAQPLMFRTGTPVRPAPDFTSLKAVNNVRTELLKLLAMDSLHALDRLDLTVRTTVASDVQAAVGAILQDLSKPDVARAMGLIGDRLLSEDQLESVRFSVLLYESTPQGNKLRVQTDNLDMPFDLNDDSKLDLGSTAKLRALISYLQVVEALYHRFRDMDGGQVPALANLSVDPLRQWVASYLRDTPDGSLQDILDAAMQRHYSANPNEAFFTAGGRHRFGNFDSTDNHRIMTVEDAFNRSVNLVFIRMMRDVSRYHINEIPGINALLENGDNPLRHQYLQRFADQEGQEFLLRFYNAYRGKRGEELMDHLASRTRAVPYRLAMAFRSVRPDADMAAMARFMASRLGDQVPGDGELRKLYDKYGKDRFNSNDRAYLAGIHPLELWLVGYLLEHPDVRFDELVAASADERQTAYAWLFKTKSWNKQQNRIRILVEEDAFEAIHDQWRQLGYPFPSLVPSYATALGVSADRPAALTELMGIVLNDGYRLPMLQIERLHFAEGTPYETELRSRPGVGEQVLSVELATTVRRALMGIVESGTARRLSGTYRDLEGNVLAVGGKTGTGDHRHKQVGRSGQVISETVVNRNAIFTFFIDDRFFGTILASVGGPHARSFDFTSGLAVQLLKALEPALQPLVHQPANQLAGQ